MNIQFCTVADSNYLLKGLAMNSSINFYYKADYILHWLCIDDLCYERLIDLNDDNIIPYRLSDFERRYPELKKMKSNPPTMYGDAYSNYCWSLTPWFCDHCLYDDISIKIKHNGLLIYVDADILFLNTPQLIIDIVGNKSVGIHTHRFSGSFHEVETGWYNVGVVVFRNDSKGMDVVHQWKNWLIDTNNPYYKSHGKTGDQKYLELFFNLIGKENICVFDNGTQITHLAPWCADIEPNKIPVFYHFSHFNYDLVSNTWTDSHKGEWNPAKDPAIRKYYEHYFQCITARSKTIKYKISIVGNIKIDETKLERVDYFVCCLKSFEFLKQDAQFLINLDNCSQDVFNYCKKEFIALGYVGNITRTVKPTNYGEIYLYLLDQATGDFILNFMEDHFCTLDKGYLINQLLNVMANKKIDVCKASFYKVEQNSLLFISTEEKKETSIGTYFLNNESNFECYCQYYQSRYYLGVNFITSKVFAIKFWSREIKSGRPHEWEIVNYDAQFMHKVLIPAIPIMVSIDDDHGEENTCLLKKENQKFKTIYDTVIQRSKL